MACVEDEKSNFKHYCRVCKKGFVCGRALGGHMRAHGIGDETSALDDDEDVISDWEERFGGGSERSDGSKKMYQLRTNPNRLKSCRTCENCGKEFLSWKPFLEHRKCSSDDSSKSLVSSPDSDDAAEEDGGGGGGGAGAHVGHRWSKRKRSLRSKVGCFISASCSPSEDDDILLARCLVQLANTVVEQFPMAANQNKGKERSNGNYTNQNKGKGVVSATAPKLGTFTRFDQNKERGSVASAAAPPPKGMFECKACKKVFNSHQALGGHRASHKKVKGCYAAKEEQQQILQNYSSIAAEDGSIMNGDEFSIAPSKLSPGPSNLQFEQGAPPLVGAARRKSKVHECSICHRVFGSGQALGGHKRCHWITTPETPPSLPIFHFQDNNTNSNITATIDKSDKLDLNIPAIDMQLQPWIDPSLKNFDPGALYHSHDEIMENYNKINGTMDTERETSNSQCVEDEVDRKLIKLAKLSDLNGLKEMGNSDSSSQWLQVGIGPTAKAAADV